MIFVDNCQSFDITNSPMGIIRSYIDDILDGRSRVLQSGDVVVSGCCTKIFVQCRGEISVSFKIQKCATLDIIVVAEDIVLSKINLNFELSESANLKCLILAENCQKCDISAKVSLDGENASSKIKSFFCGSNTDLQRLCVNHIHNSKNSTSVVLSKSVLDGAAKSEFFGDITISENADCSDALQKNDNILLSDLAKATSCPYLNILNNNVKCSHGATVGTIDGNVLLYMMSRGIDRETCNHLIIDGMVSSIIND